MVNKKLKYLNEAGFTKEETKKIRKWIKPWISEFLSRSDFAEHNVKVCDFKNEELFFFTTCHDMVGTKSQTDKPGSIRDRKDNIVMSLFLKQLTNQKIKIVPPECTHCGHKPIDMKPVAGGYYRYCSNCGNTIIDTFYNNIGDTVFDTVNNITDKYGGK